MARTITLYPGIPGIASPTVVLVDAADAAQPPVALTERTNARGVYDGDLAVAPIAAGTYVAVLYEGAEPIGSVESVQITGVDPETAKVRDTFNAIGGGAAGSGSELLTIRTEEAGGTLVQNVRVEVIGTTLAQTTNTQGEAAFNLDPGDYTLRFVAPPGYDNPPDTPVTVVAGTNPPVVVTMVPSAGGMAGLIRVICQVRLNGVPIEGARVTATLNDPTSAVDADTVVPSTLGSEGETDPTGRVDLDLYRADAFSQGDGEYTIEAKHDGKVIWSYSMAMPNQEQIYLPALKASP